MKTAKKIDETLLQNIWHEDENRPEVRRATNGTNIELA
jgi:hypothetical protein